MRGSISYQVNRILKQSDGHGISKYQTRRNSDIKGESGHVVSPLIHSSNYRKNIEITGNELGRFAKLNGEKDMEKITNDIVEKFIKAKIDQGLKYGTISGYLSRINKIGIALNSIYTSKTGYKNEKLFTPEGIKEIRKNARIKASKKDKNKIKTYPNSNLFVTKINPRSRLQVQLIAETGIRRNDAIHINKKQLLGNNTIMFKSKGGKIIEKKIKSTLYKEIEKRVTNHTYNITARIITSDMKKVALENNIKWAGIHGLRHAWAKNDYRKNLDAGLSMEESLLKTSQNMSHNRAEITKIYLLSY